MVSGYTSVLATPPVSVGVSIRSASLPGTDQILRAYVPVAHASPPVVAPPKVISRADMTDPLPPWPEAEVM